LRGSGTHHRLRQRVLRLERELDPRGPRFENAGLWRKVGGEVQLRGGAIAWGAHARAKCEAGIEV
jgi:hypothetical protein